MNSSPIIHDVLESHELYGWPDRGRVLFSCEHASNRLPEFAEPEPADLPWMQTHWAYDIGVADLVRELVRRTESMAVLSRFSRLLCDANRDPNDPAAILPRVEQHVLGFNEFMAVQERSERIERYHKPYHDAIDELIQRRLPEGGDFLLLSMHSFVPALYGLQRNLDVGVLFNPYESVARRLAGTIKAQGLITALNEPYSGRRGLIYSAARHGLGNQVIYLELEINQALLASRASRREVAGALAEALKGIKLRKSTR